ncbi:MAG: ABC transporter permease [Chitinophagales bacterium]|nr:ABC transporter permease [Chitinophagales bacterium]MDW8420021.1 ABC transporter permease subunit [Chitinophagales bacterium]
MLNLIGIELYKILKKPRTYIGFAAIAIIVLVVELSFYADGKQYLDFVLQSLRQHFVIQGEILNGSLMCFVILQMLIVQMPLLVALVAGDLISGEASTGTVRMLLSKPYTRSQIFFAKYVAGSVYTFALILWLGALALGIGIALFGTGDLLVLKSDELVVIKAEDVWWRFSAALLMAFVSLSVVTSFSLMLSCFSDNSITPIVATMSVIIIFTIIGALEIPMLEKFKSLLFTTHMVIWRNFFDNPLPMRQIVSSVVILLGHIVLFLIIAHRHFVRKDILN